MFVMTGLTIAPPIMPQAMSYEPGSEFILAVNLLAVVISVVAMVYWVKLYRKLYKADRRETQG